MTRAISAAGETSTVPPTDQAIASSARALSLVGEVVGFLGLMLLLLASILTYRDPWTIDFLMGRVSIPHALLEYLPGLADAQWTSLPIPNGPPTDVLFVAMLIGGAIAANRERWMLTGLFLAVFVFPWSAFGITAPFGAMPAVLIVLVAGLRYLEISGVRFLVITLIGLFFGPPVLQMVEPVTRSFSGPTGLSAMVAPEVVPDIVNIDPSDRIAVVAAAYVSAQKKALDARLDEAKAVLQLVEAQPTDLAGADGRRLDQIYSYLQSQGTFGADQQQAAIAQREFAYSISKVLGILGLAAIIASPLVNRLSAFVLKRARRVQSVRAKLDLVRRQNTGVAEGAMGRPLRSNLLETATSADGLGALDRVNRRINMYAIFATAGVIAAVGGLLGYWVLWLPAAYTNKAFSTVGVIFGSTAWLAAHGISFPDVVSETNIFILLMPFGFLAFIIFAFVYRRLAKLFAAGLAALVAYLIISNIVFVDQLPREVEAAAITPTMRSELEKIVSAGVAVNTMAATVSASFADLRGKSIAKEGQSTQSASNRSAPQSNSIPPEEAAYILAQIAYIENRPQVIGPLLGAAVISRGLVGHNQRLDLMAEWAIARGEKLPNLPPSPLFVPMAITRVLGDITAFIILAGLVLGMASTVLYVLADNRRNRIADLVTELSKPSFGRISATISSPSRPLA